MEYEDLENNNLSLSRFEKMLNSNKLFFFDSNEFESIISFYLENGKIKLAKKAVKLGIDQHPESVNLALFEIEILIFENHLDKAEQLLDNLLYNEPSNEEIHIQKANIYSKRKLHHKSIESLKNILIFNSENAEVYSLIGIEYLFMEDFENAKVNFIESLNKDINDYSSLYNIVYCFEILEQQEKAIEFLNKFLNNNPYCEVAWHQLGKQHVYFKEYKKAITAFEFAIISDEYFIGAYIEKGKSLEKLLQYKKAIENYKLIIGLKDESTYPIYRIGICYKNLGNIVESNKYFYRCIDIDSQMDKSWLQLAINTNSLKDYNKALIYINKAIEINTENKEYWKLYANINIKLKFYEEADLAYQKIIDLDEADESIWLGKIDMLIKLGEFKIALGLLNECLEIFEEKSEILYRISGIYFSLNNNKTGISYLKKALKVNQSNKYIFKEIFKVIYNYTFIKNLLDE
jgi:tetratricopeptide (TPR) repeat protein